MPRKKKAKKSKSSKKKSSKKLRYSKAKVEDYAKKQASGRVAFGFDHCQRVYRLAKKLGSNYDDEILHATAFLHDVILGDDHEKKSAKRAELVLRHERSKADIFRVQEAIRNHTALGEPKSVEAILVHDAAILDCLGGVGMLQLAFLAYKNGKNNLKGILKYIQNFRDVLAEKLILKQSISKAADKDELLDLVLDSTEEELNS